MKTKRVLPADVYDTLELSALAYGGIGATVYFKGSLLDPKPCCIHGHAKAAAGSDGENYWSSCIAIRNALYSAAIDFTTNDVAVARINERKRQKLGTRVSFAEWCEELGVVRGDA